MGQPMLPILPPQLDSNDSEIEVCPTGCLRMNSADVAVFCSFFFLIFIYLTALVLQHVGCTLTRD